MVSTATVMALTATCNSVNITAIKQELSTDNCETMLWSPDRSNLFCQRQHYHLKNEDFFEFLEPEVSTLTTLGINTPRKFFLCRNIELFEFYRDKLGDKCLAVADNDDEPCNRIISMYHSQSPPSVKKSSFFSLSLILMVLSGACLPHNQSPCGVARVYHTAWGLIAPTVCKLFTSALQNF